MSDLLPLGFGISAKRLSTVLSFDLSLELDQPLAYPHARQELVAMKRLCEVIVRAGRESFDHILLFRIAGQNDDIGVGGVHVSADFVT